MLNTKALAELKQNRPMAIDPAAWSAIAATAASSARAESVACSRVVRVGKVGIGVLPMMGMIGYRSALVAWCGGCDLATWVRDLRSLDADASVNAVYIDCYSPGGFTDFLPEAAAAIRSTAKPTVACVNPLCASAAYWLCSQADVLLSLQSGEGGSVGVRCGHVSYAGLNEKMGIEVTLVASSPQKVELSPDLKLSAEALARLQASVDEHYATFKEAVLRGRGVSARPEWARVLSSREMAECGLIDGIISDPSEAVRYAANLGDMSRGKRRAYACEMDLARHDGTPPGDRHRAALARVRRDGSYTEPWQRAAEARRAELARITR